MCFRSHSLANLPFVRPREQAHHAVMTSAMKAKQSTDAAAPAALAEAVDLMSKMYLPK